MDHIEMLQPVAEEHLLFSIYIYIYIAEASANENSLLNVIFLDFQHVQFHTIFVLLCLREKFNQFDLLHFPYVENGKFSFCRQLFVCLDVYFLRVQLFK